jgi:hypothetical protein
MAYMGYLSKLGGFALDKVVDESLKWVVKMDVGGDSDAELPLYQITQDVPIDPSFPQKIRQLMLDHEHYLPGENVVGIIAPGNLDMKEKPLFLIICFLKEYPENTTGPLNHYLLSEVADGIKLVAAADKELTPERFRFFMQMVTKKPELVKNLVVTHAKKG